MNRINKKMNWMKKARKKDEKNILILFIGIVIGLTVSIVCICRYCSLESTNAVIALVGIVLAFIGIFLSYKGLMVTNEVKEDIGIQQFKVKQQEEMAKIVNLINTTFYNICFKINTSDGSKTNAEANVNLLGIEALLKSSKYDFIRFDNCPVYYTGIYPFSKIYEENYSAYLPSSVSKNLSSLVRGFTKIDKINRNNNFVIVKGLFDNEDYSNTFQENDYSLGYNLVFLQENVQNLIDSVKKWYESENYTTDVNFVSFIRLVSYTKK